MNLCAGAYLNYANVVFLVDFGSEISVLPKKLTNGVNQYFPPQSIKIQGFGNTSDQKCGDPTSSREVETFN